MRVSRFICLILLTLAQLYVQPAFSDDKQAELEQLQQDINRLQQWLKETREEHNKINEQLRHSDEEISAIVRQIEETRAQLQKERARLKKLRTEQKQLRHLKRQQKQQLSRQLVNARKLGNQGAVKVLFNQDDPQQVHRMLAYYGYFNKARIAHIQTLISDLKRLDNIEAEIVVQEQKLAGTEKKLLSERNSLRKHQTNHKKLLTSLKSRLSKQQSDLSEKQKNRDRLQNLIREVATMLDNSNRKQDARPIRSLKGKLPRPVSGRIARAFGNTNHESRSRWQGWLIRGTEGTPVKAIHHGRVVFSDWLRGFGLLILVDHGNGYLSLYGRNQSLLKSVGDWVHQGEAIATLGSSGGYQQPGLYFEIRHQGTPKDPAAWLGKR